MPGRTHLPERANLEQELASLSALAVGIVLVVVAGSVICACAGESAGLGSGEEAERCS